LHSQDDQVNFINGYRFLFLTMTSADSGKSYGQSLQAYFNTRRRPLDERIVQPVKSLDQLESAGAVIIPVQDKQRLPYEMVTIRDGQIHGSRFYVTDGYVSGVLHTPAEARIVSFANVGRIFPGSRFETYSISQERIDQGQVYEITSMRRETI